MKTKKMAKSDNLFATLRVGDNCIRIMESDLEGPFSSTGKRFSASGLKRMYGKFKMWKTDRFGWCFPTLLIRKSQRHDRNDRTYAVTERGELVRIGMGPHVTVAVDVYVRKSRLASLQPVLDLIRDGEIKANERRDDLSTKRLNSRSRTAWWM